MILRRSIFALALILACGSHAWAVPALVWHKSVPSTQASLITSPFKFNVPFPAPVLSGNMVVCGWMNQAAHTPTTVADDAGNSYTVVAGRDDGNQKLFLFYRLNITNSPTKLVVTYSSNTSDTGGSCEQWTGIATSSAADGTGIGSGTGTTLAFNLGTGGQSLVTTQAGDLIFVFGVQDTTRNRITSWTKNASYTMTQGDLEGSMASEYLIQSAAGTIDNTTTLFTMNPSQTWNIVGGGFKAAVAGTSPTFPSANSIVAIHDQAVNLNGAGASETEGIPCLNGANLIVGAFIGVASDSVSAVTDTAGNTWAFTGASIANGGSGNVRVFYAGASTGAFTCSDTDVATITFTGPGAVPGDTVIWYVIYNAATSSVLDNAGCVSSCTATGSDAGAGLGSTASMTTLSGPEIVISTLGVTSNTVTAVTTYTFVSVTYDGEVSPAPADENNGWAYTFSNSATLYNFAWSRSAAVGAWASRIDAFKLQAAAGGGSVGGCSSMVLMGAGSCR